MSRHDIDAYVGRWTSKADIDLGTARTLLRNRDETAAWVVCFHAHQAVEKYLKAIIAVGGAEPAHAHSLVALRANMPTSFEVPPTADLAALTTYSTGPRYTFSEIPD